ncbi:biotin/methionine sulfoxide reductase [Stella humosa]|uniref:Biotin/methionine sulfoxide reductase n=1 Tax=Stella humosa TaxID=94 RepID=A0A3N1M8J7_9PROT|nr:molybdopterin-dependent oxidoreductase [Stella humosa]ROQ00043.1 biotin/methionine sulfoxide reductase [Stella humosa]BBK30725.1 biotin sulfoxide reductase [Stella humosa]
MAQDIRRVAHCSHWGAFDLLVAGGRIVGVEPMAFDPAPSDIIGSVPEWADPRLRIAQPMVRAGWLRNRERSDGAGRGREPFVPVGWDEALDLVAGQVLRVRDRFGPASIFAGSYGWTSAGRFHHAATGLKRLLGLVGGYTGHVNTYSIAAGPVILRHIFGSEDACNGGASTLDTVAEHAEQVIVFGALSPRTAQTEAGGIARHTLEGHLKRLAERGARIVLVSPARDDLPDWVLAEWLPIRPNTDTALMLALAQEIVAGGRNDLEFLARCCSGSEAFLAYLSGESDGVPKDADWAAPITGIAADQIRRLASSLPARRTMLTVSWALQRADHGEQPFWAATGLAAVIGQIGLPGGGVGFGYGSLGGVGAPQARSQAPAMSAGVNPTGSFIPVARITDLLSRPGEAFDYNGRSYTYPDTRMVYWAGGNPFHHHQDLNRLRRAWQRPEAVVVQEPFWTATARLADIVLPATTSIERNDLSGNRRSDHIIAMKKAIEPVGGARDDFAIFADLAQRLGVADAFTEGRDEMGWIRHLYEASREDAAARFAHAMPAFEEFWVQGWAALPVRPDFTYLAEFRQDPAAHRLATDSGLIVLHSPRIAGMAHADCPPHPSWVEPAEWLGDAGGAGRFHLVSRQPVDKLHSQLDYSSRSQALKQDGREIASIHPDDATRLGIAAGDTIRLWNARGACLAGVRVTDGVRPGVVILPTGAWYTPADDRDGALDLAGNPNVLTLDKGTSALGQGCSAHTCMVSIERVMAPPPLVAAPPAIARDAA